MTITAGVASIKGTYQGDVALSDRQHPGSFLLTASGAGAPGTVSADVKVTLAEDGDRTHLTYDADAVVGGVVGGVGQRVLTGVAKKTAGEFFKAVDDVLTGKASVPAPREEAGGSDAPTAGPAGVFTAPPPGGGGGVASSDFVKGTLLGAVIALAGVLVGTLVTRRRGA
jgi:hypothetical protein